MSVTILTEGSDVFVATDASEVIRGGGGDDLIAAVGGQDVIYGEGQNDELGGGTGDDRLYGGDGQDLLCGEENQDLLFGGLDNDFLNGAHGADTMYGEHGHDRLYGDVGNDTSDGGQGNDSINGADGTDAVQFSGATGGVTVDLSRGTVDADGQGGRDILVSIEDVFGGEFKDRITGSHGVNVIYGNGGDDHITPLDGNDTIYGGAGEDCVDFVSVRRDEATIIMTDDASIVTVISREGSDTLYGVEEAEFSDDEGCTPWQLPEPPLDAREGGVEGDVTEDLDLIETGLLLRPLADAAVDVDFLGTDALGVLQLDAAAGTWTYFLSNSDPDVQSMDDGESVIETYTATISNEGNQDIVTFNVTIHGLNDAPVIDEVASGRSGTVIECAGESTPGPDPELAQERETTIARSDASDVVSGGSGAEALYGAGGDDWVEGRGQGDWAYGGAGNDVVIGDYGATGGSAAAYGGGDALFGGAAQDALAGGVGNDLLNGGSDDDLVDGGTGDDWVSGEGGTDWLVLGAGHDVGWGGDGNDAVLGDGGNDTLFGGAGADWLQGGEGNDRIEGGSGDDIVAGGLGQDTFEFGPGSGANYVTDFDDGADRFDLGGFGYTSFAGFLAGGGSISDPGGAGVRTVVITFDATGSSVTVRLGPGETIGTEDFVFASSGPDRLSTGGDGSTVASGTVFATDVDIEPLSWSGDATGTYGTFSIDPETGVWTYSLDCSDPDSQLLDDGDTRFETFIVTVSDGDATDTTPVIVTILGSNDGPAIDTEAGGLSDSVVEAGYVAAGDSLATGDVEVLDVDDTAWIFAGGGTGTYGTFSIDASSGAWTYSLDNADLDTNALDDGDARTELFTITAADDNGAAALGVVAVTVHGSNDGPTITAVEDGLATEGSTSADSGSAGATDPDDMPSFVAEGESGTFGTFSIGAGGSWTYTLNDADPQTQSLDAGETQFETFTITAIDDNTATDTDEVVITVVGTNDAPSITSIENGAVTEQGVSVSGVSVDSGSVGATDPDDTPSFVSESESGTYGSFTMGAGGTWTYTLNNADVETNALDDEDTSHDTFTVTAIDDDSATATAVVTVTVQGANDAPDITSVEDGLVTEGGTSVDSGTASATDPDDTPSFAAEGESGTFGTFSIGAGGAWSYTLNNADPQTQSLDAGETQFETFTITAVDDDSATDTDEVVITVVGANDGPSITSVENGLVTEQGVSVAGVSVDSGSVGATDPDDTPSFVAESESGTYGSFTMGAGGTWTYTLNNADNDTNALDDENVTHDTFTVTAIDNDSATATSVVTVTVQGANDAPDITSVEDGLLTEGGTSVDSGTASATDPDDTPSFVAEGESGTFGTFSIGAGGSWTYTLNNADPQTQSLDAGETQFETFTITAIDDDSATDTDEVVITVVGANDGPSITSVENGLVTEQGVSVAGVSVDSGSVGATDPDDTPSFVGESEAGTFGTFTMGAGGTWTYTLNNADNDTNALDDENMTHDTFTVTAIDNDSATATSVVTVTVQGSNDAPDITAVEHGTVSEDGVSTDTGTVSAIDPDDTPSFVSEGESGIYGDFAIGAGGTWTYTLNNADPQTQQLDAGQTSFDVFTVTAVDDDAATDTTVVTITVVGSNDAPAIDPTTGVEHGQVTEQGVTVAGDADDTGTVTATDPDDTPSFVSEGESGTYGDFAIDAGGTWTYTLNNADPQTNALDDEDTSYDTFTVTAIDDNSATATSVVTVTVQGSNDAPDITAIEHGTVSEDGVSTDTGTVSAIDPDDTPSFVSEGESGTYGDFAIGADGTWTYTLNNADPQTQALDAGQTSFDVFTVTAVDDDAATDTTVVTIAVVGSNDAPAIDPTTGVEHGQVTEEGVTVAGDADDTGTVTATDPDDTPSFVSEGESGTYGDFAIDTGGTWTYTLNNADPQTNALDDEDTSYDTFTVTAIDDNSATATSVVTIAVQGSNDAPSVTATGAGTVTEDATASLASGTASAIDPDDTPSFVAESETGTYGTFSIGAGGSWTYSLNNDDPQTNALDAGETQFETFTITAVDDDSATDTDEVVITVVGSNNGPTITSVEAGTVTEQGVSVTGVSVDSGTAGATDPDDTPSFVAESESGTYGNFTMGAGGTWTYTLNNADIETNALDDEDVSHDLFTITATDGDAIDTGVVTVTVQGANDAPDITSVEHGLVTEDGVSTDTGTVTAIDPDDTPSFVSEGESGIYGDFAIGAGGTWTYTLNNADLQTQALDAGQTSFDVFTVTAVDDDAATDTTVVTIAVVGSNDAPAIDPTVGVEHGQVTEEGVTVAGDADDTGTVTATDPDDTPSFAAESESGTYGTFTMGAGGTWTYTLNNADTETNALDDEDTSHDTFTVTAIDDNSATATAVVTVTVQGSNDAPDITSVEHGTVSEDGVSTDTGTVSAIDPDDTPSFVSEGESGIYGDFAIGAGGTWTYTLNNADPQTQQLDAGQTSFDVFTVTAVDDDAATDTTVVTITVVGSNDAPAIDPTVGVEHGQVTEEGVTVAGDADDTGTVTATDPDDTPSFVSEGESGTYGDFAIDTGGTWTYTLNNADTETNALDDEDVSHDVFTVTAIDDNSATATAVVTVTVQGANDAPDITSVEHGTLTEDGVSTDTGTVSAIDPDDTPSFVSEGESGVYGDFAIGAGGTWTYTLNNADLQTQALDAGQTSFDVFTVTAVDDDAATDTTVVTIAVVGANDAPAIDPTSGVEHGQVTEEGVTVAGVSIDSGSVTATDPDDTPSFVVEGESGTYGSFAIDAGGTWTYTLNNTDIETNALDDEDVSHDTFTVTAIDDNSATATAVVTVMVQGSNDAPDITSVEHGTVSEDGVSTDTGTVSAIDPDDTPSFVSEGESGIYGDFAIGSGGTWTYTLNNADPQTQQLDAGQTSFDVFTVTAVDDDAATDTTVVTIAVVGSNDAPAIDPTVDVEHGQVTEQGVTVAGDADDTGTVTATDPDDTPSFVSEGESGTYGDFAIDTGGTWTYTLNNADPQTNALDDEDTSYDTFTVTAIDDNSATATAVVTVTVQGSNDAPDITSVEDGLVTEDGTSVDSGTASAIDPDDTPSFVAEGESGTYGTFSIGAGGTWTYTLNNADSQTDALDAGETQFETFTITATDDDSATDTDEVVITVVGANDAPTIDPTVGVEHGQVTEEGVTVAGDADDTGTVTASDPDDTPSFVSEGESGTYGSFAIDAGGTWTYTLNNTDIETDALDAGDTSFDLFTITAIDDDNATATSVVTITVHGANDAPSVSVGDGTVTEAGSTLSGVPTATGTALETDPDDPPAAEPVFGGTTSGTYGSFSISTLGAWTYSLDNGDTDTDALTAGQTAFDTFTITATDDDSATGTDVVTITVIGEEEGVAIGSGGLTDSVVESGSISTGPIAGDSLAAGDVNASGGDGGYVFSFGGSATYGTFSGDTTTGEWTYTLNQSATNVQQLDTGDTATEVFTVTVDDQAGGTATANITVTVIGTNDAPTITGDVLSGTVTELGISFTGSDPDNPTLITVGTMTASGDVDTTDFDDTVAIFSGDATGSYGVFDIDSTTGQWTYTLNAVYSDTHEESEFPNLTSGQTEFETFTVTAVDDNGAIDTDVVVITVHGQDEFCILDLRQTSGGGSETLTLYGDQPSFTTEPFSPGDTPCANIMVGENGYEIFYGDERSDTLFGGEQDDTLYGGIDNDRLFGGSNDDVAVGNAGDDRIFGGNNDDMIYGDVLFAGPGADPASPGSVGNDVLYGGNGVDIIFGDNGLDDAFGGNDEIFGEDGGDTLRGEGGDDVIFGGVLGDEIWGGFGEDTIYGGAGADDFNYRSIAESPEGAGADTIYNFGDGGDEIDLSAIDAIAGLGDNAFTLDATADGTLAAGEMEIFEVGSDVHLYFSVTGGTIGVSGAIGEIVIIGIAGTFDDGDIIN